MEKDVGVKKIAGTQNPMNILVNCRVGGQNET